MPSSSTSRCTTTTTIAKLKAKDEENECLSSGRSRTCNDDDDGGHYPNQVQWPGGGLVGHNIVGGREKEQEHLNVSNNDLDNNIEVGKNNNNSISSSVFNSTATDAIIKDGSSTSTSNSKPPPPPPRTNTKERKKKESSSASSSKKEKSKKKTKKKSKKKNSNNNNAGSVPSTATDRKEGEGRSQVKWPDDGLVNNQLSGSADPKLGIEETKPKHISKKKQRDTTTDSNSKVIDSEQPHQRKNKKKKKKKKKSQSKKLTNETESTGSNTSIDPVTAITATLKDMREGTTSSNNTNDHEEKETCMYTNEARSSSSDSRDTSKTNQHSGGSVTTKAAAAAAAAATHHQTTEKKARIQEPSDYVASASSTMFDPVPSDSGWRQHEADIATHYKKSADAMPLYGSPPSTKLVDDDDDDDDSFVMEDIVQKRISLAQRQSVAVAATTGSRASNPTNAPSAMQPTTMASSKSASCAVNVAQDHNLASQPCTTWNGRGATTSAIEAHTGFTIPGAVWVPNTDSNRQEEDTAEASNCCNETEKYDQTETTVEPTEHSTSYTGSLAVANEVEEQRGAIAVTVNPDYDTKRDRTNNNHRFYLYAFLAFTIIVAVAIGAAGGVAIANNDPEIFSGTAAPTSYRESLGMRAEVERVVGREALLDPSSPYSKALDWITFDDPQQLTPDVPNFIQRYIASYFYFSTTKDGPWLSCNPPDDPWNGETFCTWSALSWDYLDDHDTFFYNLFPSSSWLSNITECSWAGLECDDLGQIVKIRQSGLSGYFPEGILNLPLLQEIDVTGGSLMGPLPAQLGSMKWLQGLSLAYNKFTGSIPSELWSVTSLRDLSLSQNLLTGTLSAGVANLRDLSGLTIRDNSLEGTLPSDIGLLTRMMIFDVSSNHMTGIIPVTIENWKRISILRMSHNEFEGPILDVLSNLNNLQDLSLGQNPALSGTIPDSLYQMTEDEGFTTLDLSDCSFQGTISPEIGNLWENLRFLGLANNKFRGVIPSEFSRLIHLSDVTLNGNAFSGTVPTQFCLDNTEIKKSLMSFNFKADCAPSGNDVEQKIELGCTCCTECCDRTGAQCLPTQSGNR